MIFVFFLAVNSTSYPKDPLLLGELSCAESPEVDVRFTAGDDDGAVTRVKVHSEHGLVGTLHTQQCNKKPLVISTNINIQ